MNCIRCELPMAGPRRGYWFECTRCGYLASDLEPAIGDPDCATMDEGLRGEALQDLRRQNFERILDVLEPMRPPGSPRLLDVGCAHGWFLEAARTRGYDALGLEPDAAIAALARGKGLSVIEGYFPDALPAGERYDVITFNDVYEHLPDPRAAARACFERLRPGGLLVMNLPSSRGALFRLARLLDRVGVSGPLDRLWQRGFPSPHLSYFHPEGLAWVMARAGFREVHRGSLVTFTHAGLWQRLRWDRGSALPIALAMWVGLSLMIPFARLLPSDISLQVFVRADETGPGADAVTRLLARQGVVFIAAGLTQLLVDWGVFSALYALTGVAVAANLSGRAAAAGVGFWLNGRYTFAVDGQSRLAPRNFMRYLVVFVTLTAISTAAVVGIEWLWGPAAVYWGKPLVEAMLAVLSFLVAKLWVYD